MSTSQDKLAIVALRGRSDFYKYIKCPKEGCKFCLLVTGKEVSDEGASIPMGITG